jgi:hypothetical protein
MMFFAVRSIRALFAMALIAKTMTMGKEDKRRGKGGGRFDRRGRDHNSCDNFPSSGITTTS